MAIKHYYVVAAYPGENGLSLGGSTISIESSRKITSLTIHNLQTEFAKLRNVDLDKTVVLNIIKLPK